MNKEKYKFRAELLKGGYHKLVAKYEKVENDNVLGGVVEDPVQEDRYTKLLFEIGQKGIKECHRMNRNQANKTYKLRKKIKSLLEFPCLFLTATFRDEVLNTTNEKTRREYVVDFLNSFSNNGYVANIDFGVDDLYTHREHYHILVAVERVSQDLWKYGNLDWQKVRVKGAQKEKSIRKIPRYIAKLTNHAVKDSCKQCRLIYSRDKNHTIKSKTLKKTVSQVTLEPKKTIKNHML